MIVDNKNFTFNFCGKRKCANCFSIARKIRCYRGFGNAFWLIALSWDLKGFWNKLCIWEYPLCWNLNGRAI